MKRLALSLAGLAALAACASTPVNPSLLSDAQLLVDGLQAVNFVVSSTGIAPAADTALASAALNVMQSGLTALKGGTKTADDYAKLAQNTIDTLAPVLLKDLKANPTIVTGVGLVRDLIPVIAADVTVMMAPKAGAPPDVTRAKLAMWVRTPK